MTASPLPRLLPFLLATALLAGCGEDRAAGPAADLDALSGPPRWRLVREEVPAEGQAVTLHVRTPVRVRLRGIGTEHLEEPSPWRRLAAGQSLRVNWAQREEAAEQVADRPGGDDTAAGRTQVHALRTHYHFGDRSVNYKRIVRWTRPEHGKTIVVEAVPPGGYEALALPGSVELMTLVVADIAKGEVRARRRAHATRVKAPEPLAEGDRLMVWRLFLDVEPLAD